MSSFKFSFEGTQADWERFIASFRVEPFGVASSHPGFGRTLPVEPDTATPVGDQPEYLEPLEPEHLRPAEPRAQAYVDPEAVIASLPKVSPERRHKAFSVWEEVVLSWVENYKEEDKPQPDRIALVERLLPHALPILVMAYEVRSLQRLIEMVFLSKGVAKSVDEINEIAGNMVQVSHLSFPDLAGTYNYLPWR